MTLNDVPEIRRLFKWAKMTAVPVTYSLLGKDGRVAARELVVASKLRAQCRASTARWPICSVGCSSSLR
jgi:hypothetical protein